jgi:hypothetical protein
VRRRRLLESLFAGLDHNANGVVLVSELIAAGDAFLGSQSPRDHPAAWDGDRHAGLVALVLVASKASQMTIETFVAGCDRCFPPSEDESFEQVVEGYLLISIITIYGQYS